jgi:hypothetical protein
MNECPDNFRMKGSNGIGFIFDWLIDWLSDWLIHIHIVTNVASGQVL